jgi:hypothetical protein
MVSLLAPPVTWLRNAIQPVPAALGELVNAGPAKTPPPGAASPSAAIVLFEAPGTGPGAATIAAPVRRRVRTNRWGGTNKVATGE